MKLYKPSELADLPASPSTWIVEGLLRLNRKRIPLLCGSPHSGKSTLARQLAIAVAHGEPVLGRKTVKSKVAYWQSEETLEDAREDFLRTGMRPSDDSQLIILHPEPKDNNLKQLDKLLTEDPDIRLVIIETLDDFLQIPDLSDNPEARKAFERFDTEVWSKHVHRCCFLMLHHFKKSDERGLNLNRILGATVIAGKTDAKIYMRQVSDEDQRRTIQVQIRKGKSIEPTYLDFDATTQTSKLGVTVKEEKVQQRAAYVSVNEHDLRKRIINALANHPGVSKRKVLDIVGGNRKTALGLINELVDEQKVINDELKNKVYLKGMEPNGVAETACQRCGAGLDECFCGGER